MSRVATRQSPALRTASTAFIALWLILAALIFTFYFRFIQVRGFMHAIQVVRGHYSNPKMQGEVSPFQALTTAVSGTVGLGNIAGVAIVLISHRMPDVFGVCDRIVVVRRGEKVADKATVNTSPEEITGLITGAIHEA